MKQLFSWIVAVVLLALAIGDLEAQCRGGGRFGGRRQARQAARFGGCSSAPSYGYSAGSGGCVGGQCAVTNLAVPPPVVARPASAPQLLARR
jgi:hypothetical protein